MYKYKYRGVKCQLDLIGMITNPIGTLLGPTGLGIGGGGSAVAPGGVLGPGTELGAITAAKMAQESARELNSFNAAEAAKQREFSSDESGKARAFNSAEALANRKFQDEQVTKAQNYNTMMSNSAYQRTMADMKKAGLNPLLAFSQGGASSPSSPTGSGSSASTSPASGTSAAGVMSDQAEMLQRGLQNSISSAQSQKRLEKDLENIEADTEIKKEAKRTQKAQTDRTYNESKRILADTQKVYTDTKLKGRELKEGWLGTKLPQFPVDTAVNVFNRGLSSAQQLYRGALNWIKNR